MEKIWQKHYPKGVPLEINPEEYSSVVDLFERSCGKFNDKVAFSNMGTKITYEELNYLSAEMASFFQNHAGLKPGDRVALQMPNILQYPVALYGALRAGLVVVNTNPLYTPREMKHQFNDAGVKAIVILETAAAHLQQILDDPN
ncbi:MAG: AMP-binding protein, partial [Bdellovibrionales bacterium]|nr:AMP-binding protein [Bdellovibrionales bacterium]